MGKHPKLSELDSLFDNRSEIRLTDRQYEEKTGVALPKAKSYLIRNSAFAGWLDEKGYVIVDVQEKPVIERTVWIKKKEVSK